MMVLHRIALPFFNASVITAALFALMYSLIKMDEPDLLSKIDTPSLTWTSVPEDSPVVILEPKPKSPELVDIAPDLPVSVETNDDDIVTPLDWGEPIVVPGKQKLGAPHDAQLTILLGFPPVYPRSQAQRGTEGYVVVGFSVSPAGDVYDAYVIESSPKGAFERSALQAISKFRYRARKVNGKAVSTDGQQYMFTYEMES